MGMIQAGLELSENPPTWMEDQTKVESLGLVASLVMQGTSSMYIDDRTEYSVLRTTRKRGWR